MKFLQNSKFSNLQRKKVDGKDIAMLDFAPKTDAVWEKTMQYLSKIEGQITINETDKRVIKVEGFGLGEFAAQKEKGTSNARKS